MQIYELCFVLESLPRPPQVSRQNGQRYRRGCGPGEEAERMEGAEGMRWYREQGPILLGGGMGAGLAHWGPVFWGEAAGIELRSPTARTLTTYNNLEDPLELW